MAVKKHYTVDNTSKLVKAIIADLTEKEKKEVKNYMDLGYTLIPEERPKKKQLTEEEKAKNPFSEKNIQAFLKENGTKAQIDNYWKIYNEQAIDHKTGMPLVYKTNSKNGKFKKGEPRTKGHIATIVWFKKEFPKYEEEFKTK